MKNKIILSTVAIIFVVGVIIFFFQRLQKVMEIQIAEQVVNSQELLAKTGGGQISQIFKMTREGLLSAAHSFPMQNLLTAIEKKDDGKIKLWKSSLTNLFTSTLESHKFLSQIRFIASNGEEIVRVEREKGGSINPIKILQNKSEEFYFSDVMKTEAGKFYVSPITLNREFGDVEIPHREVIQLATPIKHNRKKKGIVVLNIKMSSVYDIVNNLSDHAWLFDNSGKLLNCSLALPQAYHDKAIETIFQQKKDRFHLPLDYYHKGGERSLVGYFPVNIGGQEWYVGSEMPFDNISDIMAKSNKIRILLFAMILISFLGVLIYFYKLYADRQRAELKAKMAEDLFKLYKQLEKKSNELQTANRSLEEIDKRKTDFLNMVAHDLRTPLTSIRSYSDLLLRYGGRSDKDREEYADIIKKESVRLSKLIDDFLDISKIGEGIVDYNYQKLDIKEVLDHFVKLFQGEGKAHNIKINCETQENLPYVLGDKERLGQVFSNLLSNAIKFTPPEGSVNIKASCVEINKNSSEDQYIKISVSDTGVGIPKESLSTIFEKFVQVNRKDIKATRGSGLGLTIVKDIIQHHGGNIAAESENGEGTTFTFTIKALINEPAIND